MTDATLTERVLVPIASEEDARATCRALRPYGPREVIAVHVIEKAGGAPDKAGVEQRQERAAGIFAAVESAFEGIETDVETEIRYGTNVAETVVAAAGDHGASAIVFSPRAGSRWVRLLTGDVALSLLTGSDRPVVVLPEANDESGDGTSEDASAKTDIRRSETGTDGSTSPEGRTGPDR